MNELLKELRQLKENNVTEIGIDSIIDKLENIDVYRDLCIGMVNTVIEDLINDELYMNNEKMMKNIEELDDEDIRNIASDVDHDCEFGIYDDIKEIARSYVLDNTYEEEE